MKKCLALCILFAVCGCSSQQKEIKESKGAYTNTKNETITAEIKWQDDDIVELELDETTRDTTKKTLGVNYGMKQASPINKEWNEQAKFFESYVKKNGFEHITMNDEGKAEDPDILSGCTISIDGFMKAMEDAKLNRP